MPLTDEEKKEISRAFSNSNRFSSINLEVYDLLFLISISSLLKIYRRKVLIAHENSCIDITGEILQCLKPGAWLNDEVIFLSVMHESHKILVAMLNLSSQVMLICI